MLCPFICKNSFSTDPKIETFWTGSKSTIPYSKVISCLVQNWFKQEQNIRTGLKIKPLSSAYIGQTLLKLRPTVFKLEDQKVPNGLYLS